MTLGDAWQQLEEHNHEQWVREYEKEEKRMGLTVKGSGGGDFKQAPPGTHTARAIKIIDLGTQHNDMYDTNRRQIIIMWELPNETLEIDGLQKPFTVSKFYTASLNEKANLRHDLEAWRGRAFTEDELDGFDVKAVLTKPCMLSIIEKNGKSRVATVSAMPKGMEAPPQFNQEVFFSLEDFNQAQFDDLPKGIQDIIKRSPEYQSIGGVSDPHVGDLESDIPFSLVVRDNHVKNTPINPILHWDHEDL